MKKKRIWIFVTLLLIAANLVQATEGELSGTLDLTYVSRYIWRGFDIYKEDHSGIQPSVNVDLYGTGFGFSAVMSRTNGGGAYENQEEIDYTLYYGNKVFENELYATNYKVGWMYYNYPDNPRKAKDTQEIFAAFSWPDLLACGVVPSYTVLSTWPSEGKSAIRNNAGWVHILGLGYDLTTAGVVPGFAEHVFHLSAAAVYNDGSYGKTVDHDWSHAVFGISTAFDLGNNLTFTPGIYYQSSWDDSVNTSDEYWTSLTVSYAF